jgi:DNA-binding CsgD family transcriptional regulator
MRVNLSLSETASILGVNTKSVEMARYRIKKKLELSPDDDLVTLMMTIS